MKNFMTSLLVLLISVFVAQAQTTTFTYQGKLTDGGVAANGQYDLTFKLFSSASGGEPIGSTITRDDVTVTSGVFTVNLDFGSSPFTATTGNYLEIAVRPGASTGGYTQLLPRQPLASSPYAVQTLRAASAAVADNANSLGGVAANQFVQTTDARLSDARTPLPNSPNYIQNTTVQQTSSNFSIGGNGFIAGKLGIGGISPTFKLDISDSSNQGLRVQTNAAGGRVAEFGGNGSFFIDAPGVVGGRLSITETGEVGIGTGSLFPLSKLHVAGTGIVRVRVDSDSNSGLALALNEQSKWSVATVTGGNFQIFNDAIGQNAVWINTASNNVGIKTNNPMAALDVNGQIRVVSLGVGGTISLCRNVLNEISSCSSSLRYKNNISQFSSGLNLVKRFAPITFDWKSGGLKDLGLGAEDVAAIEPLLVTYNDKGEVEGVKYDRVGVVLINAVKEQQAQIESQQTQIERQQKTIIEQTDLVKQQVEKLERQQSESERQKFELEALKKLVCANNSAAELCRSKNQF